MFYLSFCSEAAHEALRILNVKANTLNLSKIILKMSAEEFIFGKVVSFEPLLDFFFTNRNFIIGKFLISREEELCHRTLPGDCFCLVII